jgi:hypothetical protein
MTLECVCIAVATPGCGNAVVDDASGYSSQTGPYRQILEKGPSEVSFGWGTANHHAASSTQRDHPELLEPGQSNNAKSR